MPITEYSWKFKKELPLLDESEYAEISPLVHAAFREVSDYRKKTGDPLTKTLVNKTPSGVKALSKYKKWTGITLDNVLYLQSLRACDYGAPCPGCRRPFRTPRARYCMECGYTLAEGEVAGSYLDAQTATDK